MSNKLDRIGKCVLHKWYHPLTSALFSVVAYKKLINDSAQPVQAKDYCARDTVLHILAYVSVPWNELVL